MAIDNNDISIDNNETQQFCSNGANRILSPRHVAVNVVSCKRTLGMLFTGPLKTVLSEEKAMTRHFFRTISERHLSRNPRKKSILV